MNRINRKLHLWLALPFGVIITLISLSGAFLSVEPEVTEMVQSHLYKVEDTGRSPLPISSLMESATKSIPEDVTVKSVTVSKDASRAYQFNLSKPHRAILFVDQYTGQVLGQSERLPLFGFMFRLHRWLLSGGQPGESVATGKLIVGISTIAFVIVLVTGFFCWLPMGRKHFWRSLKISFAGGWRGFWRTLHVAGGVYVGIFVLIMALTGLTWSFGWYNKAVMALCGVEQSQSEGHGAKAKEGSGKDHGRGDRSGRGEHGGRGERGGRHGEHGDGRGHEHHDDEEMNPYAAWDNSFAAVKALNPEAENISVSAKTVNVSAYSFWNPRATDKYEVSPRSGEIKNIVKYADAPKSEKVRPVIYALHTGTFGGIITRTIWFLAALFCSTLPLTGYYIWYKKKR